MIFFPFFCFSGNLKSRPGLFLILEPLITIKLERWYLPGIVSKIRFFCATVKASNFGPHGHSEACFLACYHQKAFYRKNERNKSSRKTFNFANFVLYMFARIPPDHLLLDRYPNIGPLISRWELDNFKNCWNKSFRTSKFLTLMYQQLSNLLISQRDMSGPRLGALSNKRWSGVGPRFP